MKNITELLKSETDNDKTPSIQYTFFDTDSIIYEGRYGYRNVLSKTPVDSSTTYNLFSVTKTFTALAVLQLAQAGKIQLQSPVSDCLPEFPYNEKITVEQLLNHNSGIPNPLPLRWIHLQTEHEGFNRSDFFNEIFSKNPKLLSEPGARYKYSNLGYVLLGQLIEKISGQSYENYINQHILDAVGIRRDSLGFEINPSIHATGYHKWFSFSNVLFGFLIDKKKFMGVKEGKWKPFYNFYTNGISYGGMIGSAEGLIKYAQSLLLKNSPLINDNYKKILFTESIIDNKPTGMSFSWFTGNLKGQTYFAHAGGGGGYYIELRIYPGIGTGSVILFNRSGMKDERFLDKVDNYFLKG